MFFISKIKKPYKTGLNNRNQKVFPDNKKTLGKEKKNLPFGNNDFFNASFYLCHKMIKP